jgi:aminobenzoyl-glutamate transport protein
VTPFNAYIIIALAVAQRYRKDIGLGGFIALTAPYSLAFLIGWTVFLLAWVALGIPLGPGDHPLWYVPPVG